MRDVFNFNPGPAMLPEAVLLKAQAEFMDWRGTGMSPMEIGHRSAEFKEMTAQAEADLRELMNISDDYAVLFLPGGATPQFAMAPLNLCQAELPVGYFNTGYWSKKAIKEAQKFREVDILMETEEQDNMHALPKFDVNQLGKDYSYIHYTANETIDGIEMHEVPDTGSIPLVSDFTSTILSHQIDVNKFGIIYAGAQKNLGPSGIAVIIIRKDLIGHAPDTVPSMFNYQIHFDNGSCFNTPPTYNWYMIGLLLEWVKAQGGVKAMAEISQRKINKLYHFIDNNDFYLNKVHPSVRSWMNVPFLLADDTLNAQFLSEAKDNGLVNLAGHRSVGGMRASVYLGMPEEGVDRLVEFMQDFAKKNG